MPIPPTANDCPPGGGAVSFPQTGAAPPAGTPILGTIVTLGILGAIGYGVYALVLK